MFALYRASAFPSACAAARVRMLRPSFCASASTRSMSSSGMSSVEPPQASDMIHNSIIPTMHFQASLPRLPIPPLEDTLRRYLYFLEPLVNEAAREATRKYVADFGKPGGLGAAAHAHLVAWDAKNPQTSYISEMWGDQYLRNRDSLLLSLNPQLTWTDDPQGEKMEQATRAANIIYSSLRYHIALEAGKLQPDVYHTKPFTSQPWFQYLASFTPSQYSWYVGYLGGSYALDMSQYSKLFSSTRLPGAAKDELRTFGGQASRHVVVQRGPRFYKVRVLTDGGRPLPIADIEASLRSILKDSQGASEAPVGALTAIGRTEWAAARGELAQASPRNAENLALIDSALLTLSLDDAAPTDAESLSRVMLHGDARNRWFDKCLNIIICANGKAGVNWEHAWGDGVAVLNFVNEVHKDVIAMPKRVASEPSPPPAAAGAGGGGAAVSRLAWDLPPTSIAAIRRAEAASDAAIKSTDLRVYQSDSLRKADISASNLNPDGVMQMILQMAHYHAHGPVPPSTYESASTAGFKHGRTEVVRPVSPLSVEVCKVFGNPASTGLERYEALAKATARHKKTSYDSLLGIGVDRHLFALSTWADRLRGPAGSDASSSPFNAPPHPLFTDPSYLHFKNIRLSTSTLASPAIQGGGFGPVSPTSYGIGYGTDPRGVHFHIMNYKGCDTSAVAFADGAEKALREVRECIAAAKAAGAIKKEDK